jgi:hypothetical protein
LGGGDELGPVVSLVAKTLVIDEYPPKLRIIALALVDQHPDKLRLDKLVAPLPRGADALAKKCCDRRLEASVVAAVGATVVAAVCKFALSTQ